MHGGRWTDCNVHGNPFSHPLAQRVLAPCLITLPGYVCSYVAMQCEEPALRPPPLPPLLSERCRYSLLCGLVAPLDYIYLLPRELACVGHNVLKRRLRHHRQYSYTYGNTTLLYGSISASKLQLRKDLLLQATSSLQM